MTTTTLAALAGHVHSLDFLLSGYSLIHTDYSAFADLNRADCGTFCRHDEYLAPEYGNFTMVCDETRIQREV